MKLGEITMLAVLVFGATFGMGLAFGTRLRNSPLQDQNLAAKSQPRAPLTALDSNNPNSQAKREIKRILKTHRHSFFDSMRELAKTVRDTKLADLPALATELENALPEIHTRGLSELFKRRLEGEDPKEVLALLTENPNLPRRLAKEIVNFGIEQSPDGTFELLASIQSSS